MKTRRFTTGRGLRAAAVAAVLPLLALAGCDAAGSASSNATADPAVLAKATAELKASYNPPEFKVEAPAFDASKAAGKKMWMISVDMSIVLEKVTADAAEKALGLVGAHLTVFDGKSDVTQFARGVRAAIDDDADVIILNSVDPALISGPVKQAADAGIPIVSMLHGDPDEPNPSGVAAQATYPYSQAGRLLANWIAADLGEETGAGIELITSDEVSQTAPYAQGFLDQIKKVCPSCTIYRENVPVASWQSKLASQVSTTLNSHPDVKYVYPIYDGMVTFAAPGLISSGKKDVKMISFNATQSVMKMMAAKQVVHADLGSPQAWLGWAAVDQALRVVTGNPPAKDENIGLRMFDATNIHSIDLAADESTWYQVDVETGYKKLWKLG